MSHTAHPCRQPRKIGGAGIVGETVPDSNYIGCFSIVVVHGIVAPATPVRFREAAKEQFVLSSQIWFPFLLVSKIDGTLGRWWLTIPPEDTTPSVCVNGIDDLF